MGKAEEVKKEEGEGIERGTEGERKEEKEEGKGRGEEEER